MRVQQTFYYQRDYMQDAAEKCTIPKTKMDVQPHPVKNAADYLSISSEGLEALRETLSGLGTEPENMELYSVTNDVEMEHFWAMQEVRSTRPWKEGNGNDNVEGLMRSIMDAYETLYDRIVKEHENGNRKVAYHPLQERPITLEEDLAGLDKAFERCMAMVEGYITCQQTNKRYGQGGAAWLAQQKKQQNQETEQEDYNYFDKAYQDTARSIMKSAREEFLALSQNRQNKKAAVEVLMGILNKNGYFRESTRKLFS